MNVQTNHRGLEGAMVCIVCGQAVRGARKPAPLQHNQQTVRLCCGVCVKVFQRNPEPFVELQQKVERVRQWSARAGAQSEPLRGRTGIRRRE